MKFRLFFLLIFIVPLSTYAQKTARELGIKTGVMPVGTTNSIIDVNGVKVGHTTLIKGDSIRTGVTAILPHGGNIFRDKVPAAVFVGNGFGKLAGTTQINELGNNLNLSDDTIINDVPIGFDFTYFGNTYNSLTICSNGWAALNIVS